MVRVAAILAVVLSACLARVDAESGSVSQAYADDTCAARPVAIVRGAPPLVVETSEPGWHYDGSDPKVRRYSHPVALARACWRDDSPRACTCRELAADEQAWAQ